MSQEGIGGGDVIKFADYLERKAAREAKKKLEPRKESQRTETPPLTVEQVLKEARILAA